MQHNEIQTKMRRSCPACALDAGIEQGEKNGISLLYCGGCQTLYMPLAASSDDAENCDGSYNYDGYYDQQSLAIPEFVHQRLDEIVADFSSYRQTNRLLDVGFGAGSFLMAARRAGWDAEGVEVVPKAVEHARQQGFKVFQGELAAARYPDNYFDVVAAVEVLEHLPDPLALIREAARILRPGGLFWATTPHGKGLSARALGLRWSVVAPPEHMQLFSLGGMQKMLRAAGFRRQRLATLGTNPFEIIHVLRHNEGGAPDTSAAKSADNANTATENFNRVESSGQLNEALTRNSFRRAVKGTLNEVLRLSRLGDSLKIRAEK